MAVESPEILDIPIIASIQNTVNVVAEPNTAIASNTVTPSSETHLKKSFSSDEIKKWVPDNQNLNTFSEETKVSALSLASIRAKRELLENTKSITKETVHLPTEPFTETDMLLHWNKYAQKLGDKGFRIMESLLLINDPVLNGTAITLELPNEGSKIEFESEINGLLGHLKGHLHNHDISITVIVNESVENKFAFTPQDKYNRLKEINPNLELLRKTFDLDF
ncbi:DNA polymerase III subunit gamma/tau [Flavobacterium myungsuense]|uniref:DNA polymerase III subunit gamma/tau n=2 Tax=Flavobacterium myungsuense TaxID=651823 RepID=A0ABW3J4L8_9FLAO